MARDLEQKKKVRPQYSEKSKTPQKNIAETNEISESVSDITQDSVDENTISEEKNEPQEEATPQIEEKPLSSPKNTGQQLFLLGFTVFIGTIIFTSGIFMLFAKSDQNVKKESMVIEKKTSPDPVLEPIAAPLQREEWELSVLNGSRVAGLAKKIASQLEDMGYVIKNTGNASRNDYTTTQISISVTKSASESAAFLLDMKKELGVGTSSSELTGRLDAQIIVGTDNTE